jgi:hypothetical protein
VFKDRGIVICFCSHDRLAINALAASLRGLEYDCVEEGAVGLQA